MSKQALPELRVLSAALRHSQMTDEKVIGFQISHTILRRFGVCLRRDQAQ